MTLLLRPGGAGRWWPVPLVLGTSMAVALVVQAAHWATDVIGGGLACVLVLAAVVAVDADRWAAGGQLRWRGNAEAPA